MYLFAQIIFDNILNRHIPWPPVPNYMSYEAQDLIDRLVYMGVLCFMGQVVSTLIP
jgi:hypothetical protein